MQLRLKRHLRSMELNKCTLCSIRTMSRKGKSVKAIELPFRELALWIVCEYISIHCASGEDSSFRWIQTRCLFLGMYDCRLNGVWWLSCETMMTWPQCRTCILWPEEVSTRTYVTPAVAFSSISACRYVNQSSQLCNICGYTFWSSITLAGLPKRLQIDVCVWKFVIYSL
jgi:hypothetical protein